jgi:branched-chain amino acid transport system substrate-binding protein
VILAGVEDSARLLTALRVKGYDGNVIGGPAMSREAFRAIAGTAAEGVLFPAPDQPGEGAAFFDEAFRRRYGTTPDYAAAQGYDAVRLLVAAIRKAGLNRPRIADAVRATSPWPGVSGSITWDPTGQNTRPVRLARYERGLPRFVDDRQGGNHFDSLKETILKGKLR